MDAWMGRVPCRVRASLEIVAVTSAAVLCMCSMDVDMDCGVSTAL